MNHPAQTVAKAVVQICTNRRLRVKRRSTRLSPLVGKCMICSALGSCKMYKSSCPSLSQRQFPVDLLRKVDQSILVGVVEITHDVDVKLLIFLAHLSHFIKLFF